jgi:hypothetical protein
MAETITAPARVFTRWQASAIHLLISALIAAAALFVLLRIWYPPPFFTAEGGSDLLFILIVVDVVLGPLITLIIFKSGKPSLRFDLTVIGIVQACALAYGLYVMFVARPVYVALVGDQFETVRANDLDAADVAQAREAAFQSLPLSGPVYVAVDLPKDMKQLREIIAETQKSGKLVTHTPRYYVPYARHHTQALAQSQPLEPALQRGGDFAVLAQKFLTDAGRNASALKFLPMQMRRGYGAVLIDAASGEIVTVLPPKL